MQRSNIVISGQKALSLKEVLEAYLLGCLYTFLKTYAQPQLFFPEYGSSLQVLDVGCRDGEWICDLARQYPLIHVIGVEAHRASAERAQMSAALAGLENISVLESFSQAHLQQASGYQIVRALFPSTWIMQEQEQDIFHEIITLCSSGGSLVLFEVDLPQTNSQAWNQWMAQVEKLLPGGQQERIASFEKHLLLAGCRQVEKIVQELSLSPGPAHSALCEHILRIFDLLSIFLQAYKIMTGEQMMSMRRHILIDVLDPHFTGTWTLFTLLGEK